MKMKNYRIIIFFFIFVILLNNVSLGKLENKDIQWYQINIDGFGVRNNVAPRGFEVFNDNLVIGTANYYDQYENCTPFFDYGQPVRNFIQSFKNGIKYEKLKSDGCEIWFYNDITGWCQIVGSNGYYQSGFDNTNNLEVGFLINFKNYLYAGLRNHNEGCQIWRTNNLNDWEKVVDKGFGNRWNAAAWSAKVFNNSLYVGTMNFFDGCEIFRTNDGETWEAVVERTIETKSGFGFKDNFYAWSMEVYDQYLYVGTDKGELWRTKSGITWEPVIAYKSLFKAKLHGADMPRGFRKKILGSEYLGGIRSMTVFNDELYLGTVGGGGFLILSFPKLGDITISRGFNPFGRIRHFNHGAEIWKYNSQNDKWTQVAGGRIKGCNSSGGFGDPGNHYIWSMVSSDKYLYAGTMCPAPTELVFEKKGFLQWNMKIKRQKGNAQIWRYNGEIWEKINDNGFNDEYNLGVREMILFNNDLFAGTMNLKTGLEIWEFSK